MRQEWILSLSQGRALIQLPATLSAEDVEYVLALFRIIERQVARNTCSKETASVD